MLNATAPTTFGWIDAEMVLDDFGDVIAWPVGLVLNEMTLGGASDGLLQRHIDHNRRVIRAASELRHRYWCKMNSSASRASGFDHGEQEMVRVIVLGAVLLLVGTVTSIGGAESRQHSDRQIWHLLSAAPGADPVSLHCVNRQPSKTAVMS